MKNMGRKHAHGLPVNGSFSFNQLGKFEEKLKQKEERLCQQQLVSRGQTREITTDWECFAKWKAEAERKEREREGVTNMRSE